jgi:hypothetical protein
MKLPIEKSKGPWKKGKKFDVTLQDYNRQYKHKMTRYEAEKNDKAAEEMANAYNPDKKKKKLPKSYKRMLDESKGSNSNKEMESILGDAGLTLKKDTPSGLKSMGITTYKVTDKNGDTHSSKIGDKVVSKLKDDGYKIDVVKQITPSNSSTSLYKGNHIVEVVSSISGAGYTSITTHEMDYAKTFETQEEKQEDYDRSISGSPKYD